MKTNLLLRVMVILSCFAFAPLAGCQSDKQVQAISHQGQLNDANGAANPTGHPYDNANLTVKWYQTRLCVLSLIAIVALGAGIGLNFTPLSYVSTFMVPIAGSIAGVCFVCSVAVQFWWILLIVAAGIAGYEAYYQLKLKNVSSSTAGSGIIGTIESFFGGIVSKIESAGLGAFTSVKGLVGEIETLFGKKSTAGSGPAATATAASAPVSVIPATVKPATA
jgi:hypothetical protein